MYDGSMMDSVLGPMRRIGAEYVYPELCTSCEAPMRIISPYRACQDMRSLCRIPEKERNAGNQRVMRGRRGPG